MQHTKHMGRFVGIYTTEDSASEKRRLEQIIACYNPQKSFARTIQAQAKLGVLTAVCSTL